MTSTWLLKRLTSVGTRAMSSGKSIISRSVSAQVNRLSNQVLVTTYEHEWGKVMH